MWSANGSERRRGWNEDECGGIATKHYPVASFKKQPLTPCDFRLDRRDEFFNRIDGHSRVAAFVQGIDTL